MPEEINPRQYRSNNLRPPERTFTFRTGICNSSGNNAVQNIHWTLRQLYQEMPMVSAVGMETIWKERKIICKLVCFVGCSGSHRKEFPALVWWDGKPNTHHFTTCIDPPLLMAHCSIGRPRMLARARFKRRRGWKGSSAFIPPPLYPDTQSVMLLFYRNYHQVSKACSQMQGHANNRVSLAVSLSASFAVCTNTHPSRFS